MWLLCLLFLPFAVDKKTIHNDEGVKDGEAVGYIHGSIEFAGHGYLKCGSQVKRVVFIIIILLFFETYVCKFTQFSRFQTSNGKW